MRLATPQEYRSLIFSPASAPSIATIRRNISKGKLTGGCILDGHYYVDLDEVERVHKVRQGIEHRRSELARDPRLEGLL